MKTSLAAKITLACAILTLVAFGTGYPPEASAAPTPPTKATELRYSVDMDLLRQQFRESGAVKLAVPILGEIVVVGEEYELTSHGDRSMGLPTIAFLGSAVGHPESTANLYLGEYGVYGSVEIPLGGHADPLRILFDAAETGVHGVYESWVHLGEDGTDPAGTNGTLNPGAHVGGLDVPIPPSSGLASGGAVTTTTYRDDDNEMNAWYDFDYTDDVAQKQIGLPANFVAGAKSAQLHVFARSSHCTGELGVPHELVANGVSQGWYNACSKWPMSSFAWGTFNVNVNHLLAGPNTFSIHDGDSDWNDQDHDFALDTDSDFGNSSASANGVDQAGELMWYLTITGTGGPESPPNDPCTGSPGAKSYSTQNPGSEWSQAKSTAQEANQPPHACDSDPNCSGGYGISWVTYHADAWFTAEEANWRDRIVSAAALYDPMWQALCISLRVWVVDSGAFILTSSSCSDGYHVVDQYQDWLADTWFNDPAAWNDDAYQLWTAHNLYSDNGWPPEAHCFGKADSDEVAIARTGFTELAASVVEGVDYCCADNYDPDEADERGIVSGHELAHVYGEENHPYECRKDPWYDTASDCTMMRNCKDPDRRNFYFTPGSKREILFRYHYGQETTSGYEDKADCP